MLLKSVHTKIGHIQHGIFSTEYVSENAGWCKNWPYGNAANSFYYARMFPILCL
jgi:hypothetical protein